jgi:hypothetical protein
MSLEPIARLLMIVGIIMFLLGGLVFLASRLGLNLFQLPGDIRFQSNNLTCIIPLVSSILISIVLTVALNLIIRFLNR